MVKTPKERTGNIRTVQKNKSTVKGPQTPRRKPVDIDVVTRAKESLRNPFFSVEVNERVRNNQFNMYDFEVDFTKKHGREAFCTVNNFMVYFHNLGMGFDNKDSLSMLEKEDPKGELKAAGLKIFAMWRDNQNYTQMYPYTVLRVLGQETNKMFSNRSFNKKRGRWLRLK